jgi:hypothetical protein
VCSKALTEGLRLSLTRFPFTARASQVESLLVTFWSQNFGDFQEVFLREDIINHITSKDRLIYSVRASFL